MADGWPAVTGVGGARLGGGLPSSTTAAKVDYKEEDGGDTGDSRTWRECKGSLRRKHALL